MAASPDSEMPFETRTNSFLVALVSLVLLADCYDLSLTKYPGAEAGAEA